jgi:hypothetical protein
MLGRKKYEEREKRTREKEGSTARSSVCNSCRVLPVISYISMVVSWSILFSRISDRYDCFLSFEFGVSRNFLFCVSNENLVVSPSSDIRQATVGTPLLSASKSAKLFKQAKLHPKTRRETEERTTTDASPSRSHCIAIVA